jgi:long-chain fatty acid transport protein
MPSRRPAFRKGLLALLALLAATVAAPAQQGVALSGVGPINQSMGGASTAAPIDASGALHWNPASIGGLERSEMEFGLGLLYPQAQLASSVHLGPLSGGGSDRSSSGFFPLPTLGLVYQPDGSPFTYGLGVFTIGGFSVNYPADQKNPILSASPPYGIGVGSVATTFEVLQLAPTIACRLFRGLSFGFAPTVDMGLLTADPALFAAPSADRNGIPTYQSATHGRTAWGLGFQTGLYYTTDIGWNFGASFKSPQWFEPYRFNSTDERGRPQAIKFHLDYPMIVSLGTSYTGFSRTVVALDVRYIDYKNTNGFNRTGFASDWAVQGLGWDSIFVAALGVQYQITDALSARIGYTYNTNPVPDHLTLFNIGSPLIIEHTLAVGASYRVSSNLLLSAAYVHCFENSIQGPLLTPFGALPLESIQSTAAADLVILGASVQF